MFSVQNVEAEDGHDNWDDGWYAGRVSSSVVVNERDLGTDMQKDENLVVVSVF